MFAVTHFFFMIIVLIILYYLGVFDDMFNISGFLDMHTSIIDILKFFL